MFDKVRKGRRRFLTVSASMFPALALHTYLWGSQTCEAENLSVKLVGTLKKLRRYYND